MQAIAERPGLSDGKEKAVKQDQAKEQKQTPAEEQKLEKGKKNASEVTIVGKANEPKTAKGKMASI